MDRWKYTKEFRNPCSLYRSNIDSYKKIFFLNKETKLICSRKKEDLYVVFHYRHDIKDRLTEAHSKEHKKSRWLSQHNYQKALITVFTRLVEK